MTDLDRKFVIIAKLFSTLTKPCGHFEVEIADSLMRGDKLVILILEANTIRNAACSFDYLVNNIISYGTFLETYYVYDAIGLDSVLVGQLLEDYLGFLQLGLLFSLAEAYVGQTVGYDYSKVM